ncbi:MAG TPA: hypothetical protein VFN92_04095 [Solirubrobacterales bacterium]|nr:hypothetical protein [Solirubrobacterales bacterium]
MPEKILASVDTASAGRSYGYTIHLRNYVEIRVAFHPRIQDRDVGVHLNVIDFVDVEAGVAGSEYPFETGRLRLRVGMHYPVGLHVVDIRILLDRPQCAGAQLCRVSLYRGSVDVADISATVLFVAVGDVGGWATSSLRTTM